MATGSETKTKSRKRSLRAACEDTHSQEEADVASNDAEAAERDPASSEQPGTTAGKKNRKEKKKKLTIWEKYELHKQYVKEMQEEQRRIEEAEKAEMAPKADDPPATNSLQLEDNGGVAGGDQPAEPTRHAVVGGWDYGKEVASEQKAKKTPALPWMRVPITIDGGHGVHLDEVRGLDKRLLARLQTAEGIVELFPVQAAVWQLTAGGHSRLHDACICAPTGSGKTLAYALPMVQSLTRICGLRRLRGLVVVPTRDLAQQVFEVFSTLCPCVGQACGLVAGKEIEKVEAAMLVNRQGQSGVDLIVATPGRLMAHMKKTAGFTLDHLEVLVVDEADRLLRQSYNEWIPQVMDALNTARPSIHAGTHRAVFRKGGVLKLIVSATLTQDPSKIDRLQLHCPRYIAVSSQDYRYKLPRELREFKVMCGGADKPLVLVALLNELSDHQIVVFTSSVEATHRLWVMLKCFQGLRESVVEFSSHVSEAQRQASLEMFRSGAAKILVASDALTRGMDVPGVTAVVNYDTPVYAKTYVHRAGRTARAGRKGQVYTLLRFEDVKHFKAMLRKADNTFVKDHAVSPEQVEELKPQLADVLERVGSKLRSEARGQGLDMAPEANQLAAIIRLQAQRNLEALRKTAI